MSVREESLLHCTFCTKSSEEVAKLVAGPGVYICDACIGLCNDIIEESSATSLALLTELSSRVDLLVERLRQSGVSWDEISQALRRRPDED